MHDGSRNDERGEPTPSSTRCRLRSWCRQTRQVVAYFVGDRSAEGARALRIPPDYRCRTTAATTGWLTSRPFRNARIVSAAKRQARPTMSNAGTAPCTSAWAVSYGARFPFQMRANARHRPAFVRAPLQSFTRIITTTETKDGRLDRGRHLFCNCLLRGSVYKNV